MAAPDRWRATGVTNHAAPIASLKTIELTIIVKAHRDVGGKFSAHRASHQKRDPGRHSILCGEIAGEEMTDSGSHPPQLIPLPSERSRKKPGMTAAFALDEAETGLTGFAFATFPAMPLFCL